MVGMRTTGVGPVDIRTGPTVVCTMVVTAGVGVRSTGPVGRTAVATVGLVVICTAPTVV